MIWRVSVLTHADDDGVRRDHTYRLIAGHLSEVIEIINRFHHPSILYVMIEPVGLLDQWRKTVKAGSSKRKDHVESDTEGQATARTGVRALRRNADDPRP